MKEVCPRSSFGVNSAELSPELELEQMLIDLSELEDRYCILRWNSCAGVFFNTMPSLNIRIQRLRRRL